jgi:hypothetical protein
VAVTTACYRPFTSCHDTHLCIFCKPFTLCHGNRMYIADLYLVTCVYRRPITSCCGIHRCPHCNTLMCFYISTLSLLVTCSLQTSVSAMGYGYSNSHQGPWYVILHIRLKMTFISVSGKWGGNTLLYLKVKAVFITTLWLKQNWIIKGIY